ncbi:MAG: ACT domain-containing protein [Xanthomonadaceae bacterium]|nr:ACT domain-containing protein [Xanthomonadaceae bacterium]
MKLLVWPESYGIVKLGVSEDLPQWAMSSPFVSFTRVQSQSKTEELSIVSLEKSIPAKVERQGGFKCVEIEGPLAFTETGILDSMISPLSEEKISIFTVSTFNTDFIFIPGAKMDLATSLLERHGFELGMRDLKIDKRSKGSIH